MKTTTQPAAPTVSVTLTQDQFVTVMMALSHLDAARRMHWGDVKAVEQVTGVLEAACPRDWR